MALTGGSGGSGKPTTTTYKPPVKKAATIYTPAQQQRVVTAQQQVQQNREANLPRLVANSQRAEPPAPRPAPAAPNPINERRLQTFRDYVKQAATQKQQQTQYDVQKRQEASVAAANERKRMRPLVMPAKPLAMPAAPQAPKPLPPLTQSGPTRSTNPVVSAFETVASNPVVQAIVNNPVTRAGQAVSSGLRNTIDNVANTVANNPNTPTFRRDTGQPRTAAPLTEAQANRPWFAEFLSQEDPDEQARVKSAYDAAIARGATPQQAKDEAWNKLGLASQIVGGAATDPFTYLGGAAAGIGGKVGTVAARGARALEIAADPLGEIGGRVVARGVGSLMRNGPFSEAMGVLPRGRGDAATPINNFWEDVNPWRGEIPDAELDEIANPPARFPAQWGDIATDYPELPATPAETPSVQAAPAVETPAKPKGRMPKKQTGQDAQHFDETGVDSRAQRDYIWNTQIPKLERTATMMKSYLDDPDLHPADRAQLVKDYQEVIAELRLAKGREGTPMLREAPAEAPLKQPAEAKSTTVQPDPRKYPKTPGMWERLDGMNALYHGFQTDIDVLEKVRLQKPMSADEIDRLREIELEYDTPEDAWQDFTSRQAKIHQRMQAEGMPPMANPPTWEAETNPLGDLTRQKVYDPNIPGKELIDKGSGPKEDSIDTWMYQNRPPGQMMPKYRKPRQNAPLTPEERRMAASMAAEDPTLADGEQASPFDGQPQLIPFDDLPAEQQQAQLAAAEQAAERDRLSKRVPPSVRGAETRGGWAETQRQVLANEDANTPGKRNRNADQKEQMPFEQNFMRGEYDLDEIERVRQLQEEINQLGLTNARQIQHYPDFGNLDSFDARPVSLGPVPAAPQAGPFPSPMQPGIGPTPRGTPAVKPPVLYPEPFPPNPNPPNKLPPSNKTEWPQTGDANRPRAVANVVNRNLPPDVPAQAVVRPEVDPRSAGYGVVPARPIGQLSWPEGGGGTPPYVNPALLPDQVVPPPRAQPLVSDYWQQATGAQPAPLPVPATTPGPRLNTGPVLPPPRSGPLQDLMPPRTAADVPAAQPPYRGQMFPNQFSGPQPAPAPSFARPEDLWLQRLRDRNAGGSVGFATDPLGGILGRRTPFDYNDIPLIRTPDGRWVPDPTPRGNTYGMARDSSTHYDPQGNVTGKTVGSTDKAQALEDTLIRGRVAGDEATQQARQDIRDELLQSQEADSRVKGSEATRKFRQDTQDALLQDRMADTRVKGTEADRADRQLNADILQQAHVDLVDIQRRISEQKDLLLPDEYKLIKEQVDLLADRRQQLEDSLASSRARGPESEQRSRVLKGDQVQGVNLTNAENTLAQTPFREALLMEDYNNIVAKTQLLNAQLDQAAARGTRADQIARQTLADKNAAGQAIRNEAAGGLPDQIMRTARGDALQRGTLDQQAARGPLSQQVTRQANQDALLDANLARAKALSPAEIVDLQRMNYELTKERAGKSSWKGFAGKAAIGLGLSAAAAAPWLISKGEDNRENLNSHGRSYAESYTNEDKIFYDMNDGISYVEDHALLGGRTGGDANIQFNGWHNAEHERLGLNDPKVAADVKDMSTLMDQLKSFDVKGTDRQNKEQKLAQLAAPYLGTELLDRVTYNNGDVANIPAYLRTLGLAAGTPTPTPSPTATVGPGTPTPVPPTPTATMPAGLPAPAQANPAAAGPAGGNSFNDEVVRNLQHMHDRTLDPANRANYEANQIALYQYALQNPRESMYMQDNTSKFPKGDDPEYHPTMWEGANRWAADQMAAQGQTWPTTMPEYVSPPAVGSGPWQALPTSNPVTPTPFPGKQTSPQVDFDSLRRLQGMPSRPFVMRDITAQTTKPPAGTPYVDPGTQPGGPGASRGSTRPAPAPAPSAPTQVVPTALPPPAPPSAAADTASAGPARSTPNWQKPGRFYGDYTSKPVNGQNVLVQWNGSAWVAPFPFNAGSSSAPDYPDAPAKAPSWQRPGAYYGDYTTRPNPATGKNELVQWDGQAWVAPFPFSGPDASGSGQTSAPDVAPWSKPGDYIGDTTVRYNPATRAAEQIVWDGRAWVPMPNPFARDVSGTDGPKWGKPGAYPGETTIYYDPETKDAYQIVWDPTAQSPNGEAGAWVPMPDPFDRGSSSGSGGGGGYSGGGGGYTPRPSFQQQPQEVQYWSDIPETDQDILRRFFNLSSQTAQDAMLPQLAGLLKRLGLTLPRAKLLFNMPAQWRFQPTVPVRTRWQTSSS